MLEDYRDRPPSPRRKDNVCNTLIGQAWSSEDELAQEFADQDDIQEEIIEGIVLAEYIKYGDDAKLLYKD